MSESRPRHTYIPAVDDILSPPLPPPPIEANAKPAQNLDAGLGFVVVTANVLVTAIIIIGMLVDGQQVSKAIVTGSAYFALTSILHAFIHTGALSAIIGVWQREKTERLRIESYQELGEQAIAWRVRIEDNRALELQMQAMPADMARRLTQVENDLMEQRLAVDPMQGVSTFVSAYDNTSKAAFAKEVQQVDTTAQEALTWARGLYLDTTGLPDPSQVHISGDQKGWLRVRMLGSKRGEGSKDAGLWLLDHKIILRVPGGYKLNTKYYPRRESLRALL